MKRGPGAITTKERILKTALKLFNAYGIDQITVRHIAKEMEISHGNLCYHYLTTNDIIVALYENLVDQFSAILDRLEPGENAFQALPGVMHKIFELVYAYKFLFLNFIEITRRIKYIKKRHYELIEQRKVQIRESFDVFRNEGRFRKDLPLEQYEFLIMQCFIYGDFWLSNSEILYNGKEKDKINYYVAGYMALFVPYLTEKGRKMANL
jgi:AcrR family transcriptional regulator